MEGQSASGEAGNRGSGTQAPGPGAGAPRGRGPGSRARGQPEASGGALTSQPARKPAGGGPADGRAEEFAAGGAAGRVRVRSLPLLTPPGEQRLLWTQMGQGIQALALRRPRAAPCAREASGDSRGGRLPRTPTPTPARATPRSLPACGNQCRRRGARWSRGTVPSADAEAELV